MDRLYTIVLLIFGLVVLGLATVNSALLGLAIPFVVYVGAAMLSYPHEPRLRVARRQSATRIAHGMPVEVTLSITNVGRHLGHVVLTDRVPPELGVAGGATQLLTALAPGDTVELAYTLNGQRGVYAFPGLDVEVHDALGLFVRRTQVPEAAQLVVLPPVVQVRQPQIRPPRTLGHSGFIPARRGGPGVEFFGVRAYQPGDPFRWVNARAIARHSETLLVNEFEQERVADISLILDARLRGNVRSERGSLFEHAVTATATLADAFLKRGNRVGMVIYAPGINWTHPAYGNVQRERLLRALASARTYERQDVRGLGLLSGRMFPSGSLLVVISPLQPSDTDGLIQLRAHGHQLVVLSPDPIPLEQGALGSAREIELAAALAGVERALLLRKLRQAGIHVVDWDVDVPFAQVAHEVFARQGRGSPSRLLRQFDSGRAG